MLRLALVLLFLAAPAFAEVTYMPAADIRVLSVRSRVVEGCMLLAGSPGRILRIDRTGRYAEVLWAPVQCQHGSAGIRERNVWHADLEYDRSEPQP